MAKSLGNTLLYRGIEEHEEVLFEPAGGLLLNSMSTPEFFQAVLRRIKE